MAGLAASERDAAAQRLSALEVSPTAAFLDRRSGRWATLMTSVPLLPGSGVGNELSWQEVTQRPLAGLVSLEGAVWQGFEEYLQKKLGGAGHR